MAETKQRMITILAQEKIRKVLESKSVQLGIKKYNENARRKIVGQLFRVISANTNIDNNISDNCLEAIALNILAYLKLHKVQGSLSEKFDLAAKCVIDEYYVLTKPGFPKGFYVLADDEVCGLFERVQFSDPERQARFINLIAKCLDSNDVIKSLPVEHAIKLMRINWKMIVATATKEGRFKFDVFKHILELQAKQYKAVMNGEHKANRTEDSLETLMNLFSGLFATRPERQSSGNNNALPQHDGPSDSADPDQHHNTLGGAF